MRKIVHIVIGLMLLTLTLKTQAQEFHLAQYDAFPLYLNPALTGNYLGEDADYKIHVVSRSQWRPLQGKPFSTNGLAYDMPYKRFGLGTYLLNNRSGAANFNTLNAQLSGSYFITDPKISPHLLNVGLQMGVFYKTFNPSNLLFESQYDYSTGTLNPAIANGESFQRTTVLKFDASLGVFYKYKKKAGFKREDGKLFPFVGFSINHVPTSSESFSAQKSKLPMKFNVQAGCDYMASEKLKLVPTVLYMNQAKTSELNIGILSYYNLKSSTDIRYDLIFGLNYRLKDAVIVQCGVKKENIALRMSYDITTSYLNNYNKGRGGFEITLQLSGKKGESPFKSMSKF